MMFSQLIVVTGIILNGLATLAYVIDTVKGKIQPNKVTFFLWSVAPFVVFAAQISQGVKVQSLLSLSVALFPFSVFIASFLNKKAYWQLNRFDLACGMLSLVGLILWYFTKVGNLAIVFSILADFLATLPTLIKGYKYPETEIGWPWFFASLSGFLTLITVQQWQFEFYGFPLYYFLAMGSLFITIQFKIGIYLAHD